MSKIITKLVILTVLCSCAAIITHAQTVADTVKKTAVPTAMPLPGVKPVYRKPKGPKPLTKEWSVGGHLATNGWSLFGDLGKVKTDDEKHSDMFHNVRLWQFEFAEIKSPKEYKNSSTDINAYTGQQSSPYVYGKINNFYSLKISYGYRRMIAGKPEAKTVSIHWVYAGGLAIGLLKPYYVNAIVNGAQQAIKFTDSTKPYFLNPDDVTGSAGFSKGIGETKIIPGIHAKTALHFDFSNIRKLLLAVETGVEADLYTKSVPIIADQKSVPYFFNAYVAFQIGKRH